MAKMYNKRNAFSLLELIFVIVILGIVASIGSELIARVYQQYIVQRAEHRASIKTELAALQIANRLVSAIPGTVYRITSAPTNNTYEPIDSNLTTIGDNYKGIQWVAADMDSFNANSIPGWSGFCDVNNSSKNTINTPGSNLGLANTIIENLSKDTSGTITKHLNNAALYFPYYDQEHNLSSTTGTSTGENNITLDNVTNRTVVEHYKLAWSSYALVVEPEVVNGKTYKSLFLYYNFIPTPTKLYTTGTKALLIRNISTFKFKGAGRTIRFKICKEEEIGEEHNVTACKEKAVF